MCLRCPQTQQSAKSHCNSRKQVLSREISLSRGLASDLHLYLPRHWVVEVVSDGAFENRRDVDPFRHPDLERLGRTLRDRLDETLNAEQSAARSAARRRRTLRDCLLEAEDRGDTVVVSAVDGHTYRGFVDAVGVDHVVLEDGDRSIRVAICHVVSIGTL